MGLFSKKTYVCEKCGKEFKKRVNLNGNFCDTCWLEEMRQQEELKMQIGGYCEYAADVLGQNYSVAQMKEILAHRDDLLSKFKFEDGISRLELMDASDNYRHLSDEQAADILTRVSNSTVSSTMGSIYSDAFFAPTHYNGMIVDAEDVFAVGYTTDYHVDGGKNEVILCVCFTNDPYVPVFPMVYLGKKGFFEMSKSRKGRESVAALFESLCPNLTYPVQDLKYLKKEIKAEGSVRGNIAQTAIMNFITYAMGGTGIFHTGKMHSELYPVSAAMLDSIGYIQADEVNRILKMDKMLNRNFWNKQIKKLADFEI